MKKKLYFKNQMKKFSNQEVPCILLNGEDRFKLNKIVSKRVEPKNIFLRKLRRIFLYKFLIK